MKTKEQFLKDQGFSKTDAYGRYWPWMDKAVPAMELYATQIVEARDANILAEITKMENQLKSIPAKKFPPMYKTGSLNALFDLKKFLSQNKTVKL